MEGNTVERAIKTEIDIIIIIIYPITARVVGAPHMFSQPVSLIFSHLHCPLGLGELKACPFPDVVFPLLLLSPLSSSPFHCALQDGFGQTWWTGDMSISLRFAVVRRSSCGPTARWILARTSSLVAWSLYEMLVSCGSTSFPWLVFFFGKICKSQLQKSM